MQQLKQSKKQLYKEILRFLLVGGLATLTDYLVFWLLDGVLFPTFDIQSAAVKTALLATATAVGFCAGLAVNWLLSVSFVFASAAKKTKEQRKRQLLLFCLISLIGLAITEAGVLLLVWLLPQITLFGSTQFLGTLWTKWIAKALMTALVLVFNYLGRKFFVFSQQEAHG